MHYGGRVREDTAVFDVFSISDDASLRVTGMGVFATALDLHAYLNCNGQGVRSPADELASPHRYGLVNHRTVC